MLDPLNKYENYKDFGVTDAQYEVLMKLRNDLGAFRDRNDIYSPYKSTANLIQVPEWEEIRILAKEVLKAFNYRKGEE